jgi:hypothetical protein
MIITGTTLFLPVARARSSHRAKTSVMLSPRNSLVSATETTCVSETRKDVATDFRDEDEDDDGLEREDLDEKLGVREMDRTWVVHFFGVRWRVKACMIEKLSRGRWT